MNNVNNNQTFEDYFNSLSDEDIEEYLAECEADAILSSTDYVFSQDD